MQEARDESITHSQQAGEGRFALPAEGAEAELTYRLEDGVMVILHTFTPPALRGQGIAARLMARAVQTAKEKGWKIKPVCSYAAQWFRDHPEQAEMLA